MFLKKSLEVVVLYSALSIDQQNKIFSSTDAFRRIILSTNIAETSITIPGIRYVVDTGFVKIKLYDQTRNLETLAVVPISKASAIQRAGRAGRVGPGKCYRLYTDQSFFQLDLHNVPVD